MLQHHPSEIRVVFRWPDRSGDLVYYGITQGVYWNFRGYFADLQQQIPARSLRLIDDLGSFYSLSMHERIKWAVANRLFGFTVSWKSGEILVNIPIAMAKYLHERLLLLPSLRPFWWTKLVALVLKVISAIDRNYKHFADKHQSSKLRSIFFIKYLLIEYI